MARFRAEIKGQRGAESRLGSAQSGIRARVNGWDSGVAVEGIVTKDNEDKFFVHVTGGSRDLYGPKDIAEVVCGKGRPRVTLYNPETGDVLYPLPATASNTPMVGTPMVDALAAALRRVTPWLGKMIANGGHMDSVAPNDAVGALEQAEAALRALEDAR